MSNLELVPHTEQRISEALEDFILSKQAARRSERTIEYYQAKLGEFVEWLDVDEPKEVSSKHVRAFLAKVSRRGVSDATLHSFARAVKAFLRFCEREGYTDKAPRFDMPSVEVKRKRVLTEQDFKSLLNACLNIRDKALLLFLADTGLRASELLALDWGDIDFERGIVRVRRTKSRKWRSVIIGASTRRYLLKYRRTVPHDVKDCVWRSERDRRLRYSGLRQVFLRLSHRSGVKATPHDMRRLFATWSLREGMSLFAVQGILGHSSLEMVRRYAQLVEEDLIDQHKEFGPVDRMID